MSYYDEGYDLGYADGVSGEPSRRSHYPLSEILDKLINTDEQDEWEEGYDDGYEAGRKEFEDSQEE